MPKRILTGNVISAKTDKTIVVNVDTRKRHPLYKKFVKQSKKYQAHDEANKYKVGDIVEIQESRPISKTKRFVVVGMVGHAKDKSVAGEAE
ncbi:MAG: 30S ribosomal protein S17 [Rickettsiales bacterium]|jgi:small subunit ribosomal protein S17|nr:30S ribosomal protein S17 [Rickettsiales bacterium]